MADMPVIQPGTSSTDKSAKALLTSTLQNYGLPSTLVDTLWNQWYVGEGKSIDQIILDIPTTHEFQTRFPRYQEIQKAQPGFNVSNYLDFEKGVANMKSKYGLPDGFYDSPDDISNLMVKGVSVNEYEDRVKMGVAAAAQSPVETRAELHRLYGVDLGHLTAYFLDPTRAEPELQKQVASAAISGAGIRSGFGMLSADEASRLADLGVTEDQAQKQLGQLASQKELMQALPGEEQTQSGITREQQLAAAFQGDATSQEAIRKRAAARTAAFGGGGSYGATQKGIGGLVSEQ